MIDRNHVFYDKISLPFIMRILKHKKIISIYLKIKRHGNIFNFNKKKRRISVQFKASNGQVILNSEGYASKTNCLNGIESVRKNAAEDQKFECKEADDGRFYFNLKANNGQIIASSQMYESMTAREKGIISVKKNAPDAVLIFVAIEDATF